MRIACIKTVQASPNGIDVYRYYEGKTYDETTDPPMSASLSQTFIRQSWGVEAAPEPEAEPEPEGKIEGVDVDTGTHDLTVPEVRELIADETDIGLLRALRQGEEMHPKSPRSGVLEALDARIAELTE